MHQTTGSQLRVAIVDDEPIARSRLRRLLGRIEAPGSTIVLECDSAEAFLAQGTGMQLDAVFIDIEMPGRSGLVALEEWRGARPRFVFVTAHHEHALKAFDLEATDYLTKPIAEARLHKSLVRLWRHCRLDFPPSPLAEDGGLLSDRQEQILSLIAEGLANKEVARRLGLSHFTVRNHLSALFRLFGVRRRRDLAAAARSGLHRRPDAGEVASLTDSTEGSRSGSDPAAEGRSSGSSGSGGREPVEGGTGPADV